MKIIETKGLPHTLTRKDGKTFRLFARQQTTLADNLISDEFYAEQKIGGLLLVPEETEDRNFSSKNNKGGNK